MGRTARQCPPAKIVGEISPEWAYKAAALLTYLYHDQMGDPVESVDIWHKDTPEDRHTYRF